MSTGCSDIFNKWENPKHLLIQQTLFRKKLREFILQKNIDGEKLYFQCTQMLSFDIKVLMRMTSPSAGKVFSCTEQTVSCCIVIKEAFFVCLLCFALQNVMQIRIHSKVFVQSVQSFCKLVWSLEQMQMLEDSLHFQLFQHFLLQGPCFVSFIADGLQTVEVLLIWTHAFGHQEIQLTESKDHYHSTKFVTIKQGGFWIHVFSSFCPSLEVAGPLSCHIFWILTFDLMTA